MKNWYKLAQHLDNVETIDLDERSVTRAIRDAIIAEESAVNQYETIVDSTDNERVKEVLQDIANEEKVHVGELMQLLSELLDDEDEFIEEGKEEILKEMESSTKWKKITAKIENWEKGEKGEKGETLEEVHQFHEDLPVHVSLNEKMDYFIREALRMGFSKEEVVQGLEKFYQQSPSAGELIVERVINQLQE